jgi:2-C-methyl-D-erythritol 4-phosphate cytidylyltransferase
VGAGAPSKVATDTWAVVVAAGDGARFGGRKQFAAVAGRPVVSMAVTAARSVASGVVLVVPPSSTEAEIDSLSAQCSIRDADKVVLGGSTRAASVRAGLDAVPADISFVVVHDAARPLASAHLFEAVVQAVRDGADAAVPGLRVADTLKSVDVDVVVSTVSREDLVAVQTPQAFRVELLRRAHAGHPDATDDAALVEGLGATVRVVPGEASYLKLTEPGDLQVLEALMSVILR